MPKISFKIPPGLWSSFKEQTDALFLSRAPFLDHMIAAEVRELEADIGTNILSLRAKRHISGELKRQGAKSVNIEVREQTMTALQEVARKHNLVRDAFISRMILFLRGSDSLLNYLEVPLEVGQRSLRIGLAEMPSSPMKAMEAVRDDPLFYVRHHVREAWGCGIYMVKLPQNMDWAACFIEGKDTPGTKAFLEEQRQMADAFATIEANALEGESPAKQERNQ